ncbi:MAG: translation initiation factor IF-3 [Dissulfurimicrobium hydrothermale]|uniref:translation initiation factor IF-3 n=2 Tax=Dissulfurimicrobium hydrothermale TaxID=1750598 RepID=UPI001EDBDF4D|nr:translation initiation factor IF-3 [Dissulfurimicrobium hydrothermale]UKL14661.1 translation initiation factor IF-3 [Dissulfurimicrobium hydrothermale]
MAKENSTNINQMIRASEVRLIGVDGEQLGIMPVEDALDRAMSIGLDLVEVAPGAKPPVCRIMDYGKYRYEQSKKIQEAKKKQVHVQIKEIKLRPRTDTHDMEVKKRHIREFLKEGNKVKLTVRFRGREIVHRHLGLAILSKITEELSDVAVSEGAPSVEGPTLHIILAPKRD